MKLRWEFLVILLLVGTIGLISLSKMQKYPSLQQICEPLQYHNKYSDGSLRSRIESQLEYVCPRSNSKVAIVMPFHGEDTNNLIRNIRRWKETTFAPCLDDKSPMVDLYFSNCLGSQKVEEKIAAELTPELRKCFKSIQFVYESTVKAIDHDMGSLQHLEALLDRFSQTHDYFFLMEWDTFPVRNDWVNKLFLQAVCGPDFWMKGSHPRDATNHTVFYYGWHINGNAIYNVHNNITFQLMKRILHSANPPIYDIAIDRYMTRNPDTAREVRDFRHLYMLTDFVYNMGPKPWATFQFREENPDSYFVHGRVIDDNPNAKYVVTW